MASNRLQGFRNHVGPGEVMAYKVVPSLKVTMYTTLSTGDTVELNELNEMDEPIDQNRYELANRNGDFLRISQIGYNCYTDTVELYGYRMRRAFLSRGLIPSKLNELYIVSNKKKPAYGIGNLEEALTSVTLSSDVYHINGEPVKREVIITNQPFPVHSFREDFYFDGMSQGADQQKIVIRNFERLVCRWILVSQHDQEMESERVPKAATIQRITGQQGDPMHSIADWTIMEQWRGLISNNNLFSFGDGFCGAGGVSCGAVQAGLKIKFAFDHNLDACGSYGRNNPDAIVWHCDLNQIMSLCHERPNEFKVDIMHMSPPCQAYSRLNHGAGKRDPSTKGGMRDDANTAASFGISELLKHCKPRIVTLEQTSGIFDEKNTRYLRGVISQFTALDYSLTWRELNLADWGTPQARKRLILVAACPGEKVPAWPSPTHGPEVGVPHCTINESIDGIDDTYENHHPSWRFDGPVTSGDTMLTSLIATTGTSNLHPSGRQFTVRELASLMTLPGDFKFAHGLPDSTMKRQIGNMVPARFCKSLMKAIKKSLVESNKEIAVAKDVANQLSKFGDEGMEEMSRPFGFDGVNDMNPIIID